MIVHDTRKITIDISERNVDLLELAAARDSRTADHIVNVALDQYFKTRSL